MLEYIRHRFHPLWRLRRYAWFRLLQTWIDFPVSRPAGRIEVSLFWLRDLHRLTSGEGVEPRTRRCFEAVLDGFRPDCFWDVGANIGDYAWRVAGRPEPVDIWMFEPDERNVELLRRTIRRNRLDRVTLYPVAVSDHCGTVEFMVDGASGTAGSILDHKANAWSLHTAYGLSIKRQVKCLDLDSLRGELGQRRLLIKIDVEGAEELALRGAARILREVRPVIFLEWLALRPDGTPDLSGLEWVRQLGYLFFDLEEAGNFVVYPSELKEQAADKWLVREP